MTTNPSPPLEILLATEKDLRPLIAVEEAAAMQTYVNSELDITSEDIMAIGWGRERVQKYMERFVQNIDANIWVAKDAGRVVGFTAISQEVDEQWIRKLYVTPDRQGKGIGSLLLQQAEAGLDTSRRIKLSVASYDQKALSFYAGRKYTIIGPRPSEETTLPTGKVLPEMLLIRYPVPSF